MNRRQKLKRLKRDNKFMHDIIKNTPEMEWLYNAFNKPLHFEERFVPIQDYKARREIPPYMVDLLSNEAYLEHIKRAVAEDLFEDIKDDIRYETVEIYGRQGIEASISIARK